MKTAPLVLSIAFAVVVLLIAGRLLLSGASFSLANPYWDGVSAIGLDSRAVPVYDFGQLRAASPGDTLLVIGPSVNFTARDASDVSYFMLNGGRAVVMDDYGAADSLLSGLDAPVRTFPVPLCQDVDYYRSPALPIVSDIADHSLTRNVSRLAFNHPVPLNLSAGATPLATTSGRAWLDPDDNGTIDGNESFGTYVLVANASYGKGELVVAGDADLLTNAMLKKGDNGVLLGNILSSGGAVYVDVAHGQPVPPLAALYYLIKYNLIVQALCVAAILALAYGCVRYGQRRKSREGSPGEQPDARRSLLEALRERMPLSERDLKTLNKKL